MKVISKQKNSRMCFICGMDNPIGLKAQFYNMEDGSVMTRFLYKEEHQSFPGRVHGGLIATILDELGFRALWTKGNEDIFGVTMSMEVKYRKPVPYGEGLTGRGIVIKENAKFATMQTEIFAPGGVLLAEGMLHYLKLPVGRISEGADPHEEMCYLIEDHVKDL
ncbi:MAG: PaaI family thioesterase [Lachnospiraceae bacterium]|jgi:uncharacterized protein (TIGR00369 family)|nr:PaaI family thioesterase [Lachnospiraceae bacterium]